MSWCDAPIAHLVGLRSAVFVHRLAVTASNPFQMIDFRFCFIFAKNEQRLGTLFTKTSP